MLKSKKTLAVVGLALFLLILGQVGVQTSTLSEGINQACQTEYGADEKYCSLLYVARAWIGAHIDASGDRLIAVAALFSAIGTIIIAWFTFSLAAVTKQLEVVGRQQANDTRLLERAYIAVDGLGIDPLGNVSAVHLAVRNVGRLPARNVRWCIEAEMSGNGKRDVFPIVDNRFYGDNVIPSGTEMRRTHYFNLSDFELQTFRGGGARHFIYIWGEIRYRDGFDNPRFTKFCHRYDRFGIATLTAGEPGRLGQRFINADNMRQHQYGNDAD